MGYQNMEMSEHTVLVFGTLRWVTEGHHWRPSVTDLINIHIL